MTNNEDKIYLAIRREYGYDKEGDRLVDWLMDKLSKADRRRMAK